MVYEILLRMLQWFLSPTLKNNSKPPLKQPKYINDKPKLTQNDTATQLADAPEQRLRPLTANTVRATNLPSFTQVDAK